MCKLETDIEILIGHCSLLFLAKKREGGREREREREGGRERERERVCV